MLAEGVPGRGRGSRAALAELRGGALLHDASYWRPVQLAGPLAALRATLAELRWSVAERFSWGMCIDVCAAHGLVGMRRAMGAGTGGCFVASDPATCT